MKNLLFTAVVLCAGSSLAFAQTVTVSKSGTPDYSTVADALAHFDPDPNPSEDNVIQILDDEVYDEALSIGFPVTLEGTGPDRPILALHAGPDQIPGDSGGTDGLTIRTPIKKTY